MVIRLLSEVWDDARGSELNASLEAGLHLTGTGLLYSCAIHLLSLRHRYAENAYCYTTL